MAIDIPGYDVGELLGFGGHAQVWSGTCQRSGRQVALKKVSPNPETATHGLRAEAALLAALEHPSLIEFIGYVELKDGAVLVLELAAGGSLADLLRRRSRLAAGEVGVTFSDVGSALAHAHEAGILHGDLSAGNILYTSRGRPKLADLGVARIVGSNAAALGTPAYIDPVVAAGGAPGLASDVFSLAAVALHALTGRGPWASAEGAEDVFALASTGHITGLETRLAGCPPAMARALTRALDPEPFRRGSARELALDLRASVEPVEIALQAGRLRPAGGRHAIGNLAAKQQPAPTPASKRSEFYRPDFNRPDLDGSEVDGQDVHPPAVNSATANKQNSTGASPDSVSVETDSGSGFFSTDLTHVSRPQVRAILKPPLTHRERLLSVLRSRRVLIIVAVLVGIAGAGTVIGGVLGNLPVAGALAWRGSAAHESPHRPVADGVQPTGSAQVKKPASTASPSSESSAVDASAATQVLRDLDTKRSAAYARRDVAALMKIYASSALQEVDAGQLRASIPPGCGIFGLSATYSAVTVLDQKIDSLDLRATISMSAARLECAGKLRAVTAQASPHTFALTLVGRPGGQYQIAAQTAVSGQRP